jgi:hypothetical protein
MRGSSPHFRKEVIALVLLGPREPRRRSSIASALARRFPDGRRCKCTIKPEVQKCISFVSRARFLSDGGVEPLQNPQ